MLIIFVYLGDAIFLSLSAVFLYLAFSILRDAAKSDKKRKKDNSGMSSMSMLFISLLGIASVGVSMFTFSNPTAIVSSAKGGGHSWVAGVTGFSFGALLLSTVIADLWENRGKRT